MLRLGIADPDRLTIGDLHQRADMWRLQSFGINVPNAEQVIMRRIEREALPYVDEDALRGRAATNTANAGLNQAAGRAFAWSSLQHKPDSLYAPDEFSVVLRYLRGRDIPLIGPVLVAGPTTLPADMPLTVVDGFLATDGGLTIEPGGHLTVQHHQQSRLLPGLLTLTRESYAPLVIGERAHVIVDGAVVVEGVMELREGATADVVGSIVAADSEFGVRIHNATLSVRYDPAVRGTLGIIAKGRIRVVPISWHEVR